MATRTAYVGTEAVGDVLTAANFNKLPGGWIGYAEVTSNQGSITTEVDLTGLTLSVTVNTTRRLRIVGRCLFSSTVSNDIAEILLYDTTSGSTKIAQGQSACVGAGLGNSVSLDFVVAPTGGSRSYKLRAIRGAGSGTLTMLAASDTPAFLLIEDIGPAS